MELRLAQAYQKLGLLPDDQLAQKVGIEGLEAGLDTETLRILAGLTPDEAWEARKYFEALLEEFGLPALSTPDAARICASEISRLILSRELTPYDGAREIWEISRRVDTPDFHDFDTFIYAASEMEDRPDHTKFFVDVILKEATCWAGFEDNEK
ncbi:hypothetical protein [Dongia sp.]|uniref:hypothetical protein n=1 Tax=Dongia sp. TaxID=1977262 RepID=UPI0035AE07BF